MTSKVFINDRFYKVFSLTFPDASKGCFTKGFLMISGATFAFLLHLEARRASPRGGGAPLLAHGGRGPPPFPPGAGGTPPLFATSSKREFP